MAQTIIWLENAEIDHLLALAMNREAHPTLRNLKIVQRFQTVTGRTRCQLMRVWLHLTLPKPLQLQLIFDKLQKLDRIKSSMIHVNCKQFKEAVHDKGILVKTTTNLDECTRQITKTMGLIPSDITAVNSTLTAMLFPVCQAILEGTRGIPMVRKAMSRCKQAWEHDEWA